MVSRESWVRRVVGAVGCVVLVLGVPGGPVGAGPVASAPRAAASPSTIVAIRAEHHPGRDRFVLEFDTGKAPRATVALVSKLVGDASGKRVPVPGRAIIRVQLTGAQAHFDNGEPTVVLDQAFALPNVMALRGAGDFEAVVTMGIGLAKSMPFRVYRLTNPGRIAIDVSTDFPRTSRRVTFMNSAAPGTSARTTVRRSVPTAYQATGLLDRIFAGPTLTEQASGLRLVTSGATGFKGVTISMGVARLRLTGGCSSASSFTIADSILPTLRRLGNVDWVKIYHPAGKTQHPTGKRDSLPACLVPAGKCLYLVSDLSGTDPTLGSFLVLNVKDGDVVGTGGAFYSEWFSVRGRLTDTAQLQYRAGSGTWTPLAVTWDPAKGTFVGWTPITAAQMRTYSGGGVPVRGQPCD